MIQDTTYTFEPNIQDSRHCVYTLNQILIILKQAINTINAPEPLVNIHHQLNAFLFIKHGTEIGYLHFQLYDEYSEKLKDLCTP